MEFTTSVTHTTKGNGEKEREREGERGRERERERERDGEYLILLAKKHTLCPLLKRACTIIITSLLGSILGT